MIHIDNLGLILNKKEILSGISFDARQGEITGLVGDNGSGKTMIMKCICLMVNGNWMYLMYCIFI